VLITCPHITCQTLRFANIKVLQSHQSRFHKSAQPLVSLSLIQLLIEEPIRYIAALLHHGETIGLPLLDMSVLRKMGCNKKAAERAARHRALKNSEEHRAAEAARKREQRADLKAETERIAAIDDIVPANPDSPMTMTDGPKWQTGGFSSQKIEKDLAATGASSSVESLENETTEEHHSGKRVSHGSSDQQSERSGGRTESEDWFVESAFKEFLLDPSIGFGSKVMVELLTNHAYSTVTGNVYRAGVVQAVDTAALYKLVAGIREQHPAPNKEKSSTAADGSSSARVVRVDAKEGAFTPTKLEMFLRGELRGDSTFYLNGFELSYPSGSEADMACATVFALEHGDDFDSILKAIRGTPLWDKKWERDDYQQNTIGKAIETAARIAESKSASPAVPTSADGRPLDVRDVQEQAAEQDAAAAKPMFVLPETALTSTRLGDIYANIFKPNDWPMEMALASLVTNASVLVPPQQPREGSIILTDSPCNLYTAQIGEVHIGKSQVNEWGAKALGIYAMAVDAAITVRSVTSLRAYEIAAGFRKRGVPVLMGGPHASFYAEEMAEHGLETLRRNNGAIRQNRSNPGWDIGFRAA
jgi:hypothetical protein